MPAMKESLIRTPKVGIPLRGKIKASRPDVKSHGNLNSENLDASFTASPSQISNITDNFSTTSSNSVIAAAGDLDEAESNYPIIPPLLENLSDLSGLPEFPPTSLVEPAGASTEHVKEVSTSIAAGSFIEEILECGGSCAEEISTELLEGAAQPEALIIMEKSSEKDEEVRDMEVALTRFSTAMEKLRDAIREVSLPSIEQRKQRSGSGGIIFFLVWLGEMTLAFFIGAVLVSVLLTVVAPERYPILNDLSEFNGPTPT